MSDKASMRRRIDRLVARVAELEEAVRALVQMPMSPQVKAVAQAVAAHALRGEP